MSATKSTMFLFFPVLSLKTVNDTVLVIMPAYNAAQYLGDAIDSVLSQSHQNWTLLVVDDCSTDNTREIVQGYQRQDARIRLVCREKNSGTDAIPRIAGIEFALSQKMSFDFIALLDSDDYWLPHKLSAHLKLFANDPKLGLTYSKKLYYRQNSKLVEIDRGESNGLWRFLFKSPVSTSSVLLRAKYVSPFYPLFDPDPLLKAVVDYDLWVRLMCEGIKFGWTEQPDTVYRVVADSVTRVSFDHFCRRQAYLYAKFTMKNEKVPMLVALIALMWKLSYGWLRKHLLPSIKTPRENQSLQRLFKMWLTKRQPA